MTKKNLLCVCLLALLAGSCFEDMDDNPAVASTQEIQEFIYRGLNYFYLYKEDVPELANDAFADVEAKNNFLQTYESPEALFDYLLSDQDPFSVLFDDYVEIENALAGVSMSNGMEYGLVYEPNGSGNIFGYVRYILPHSSASETPLKRGDLFSTVDDVQLTATNYKELLSRDFLRIGLSTYTNNRFELTGETASLTKMQYDENPVFLHKILQLQNEKVGYLMYNGFTRRYDVQLNEVFGAFKAEGVRNLVLDLRYNGGGAVETAVDLASMITGQFNGELFYKEVWNEDRQEEFGGTGTFDAQISNGNATNSLGLDKIYIIGTKSTASASELVINGLDPYIQTIHVGDTTRGKFQASILLYDAPEPYFARQQASPLHTYAMLPLVFKTANKAGKTDFSEGLFPDIPLKEDFFNLGELGDASEPLLAAALAAMGLAKSAQKETALPFRELDASQRQNLLNGKMILEPKK